MCAIKLYKLFVAIAVIVTCITISQIYILLNDVQSTLRDDTPIILWWTPFGAEEKNKQCGNSRCFFTQNRSYFNNSLLQAILFYGSDLEFNDLPVPRKKNVRWALLHEESPRNNLVFVHEDALNLFNYSATFSRHSDLPLTLINLPGEDDLSSTKYFLPTTVKNRLIITNKLAPVLYIQSNCDTMSDRDLYVTELMKYISIDSYGACVNNRQLPSNLKENYIEHLSSEEFYKFVAQYKFTLAFENALCDDYITEKLWRPLIVGSVPVYYGSPSFKDWIPNDNATLAIEDFKDPVDLAQYLLELSNDDEKYERHLKHKISNIINNNRLRMTLQKRPNDLRNIFEHYVRNFECLICEKLHENKIQIVTEKQYNCSKPRDIFGKSGENKRNSWVDMWELEASAARLLKRWVSDGNRNSTNQFDTEKIKMYSA